MQGVHEYIQNAHEECRKEVQTALDSAQPNF